MGLYVQVERRWQVTGRTSAARGGGNRITPCSSPIRSGARPNGRDQPVTRTGAAPPPTIGEAQQAGPAPLARDEPP
ncbi:hypothetical protein GCM10011374_27040 [Kocuria dechangensis]|uniref:Uncharacterized protein n=1 Tax=Kocuria dechangensis TaxID=1176249 RepID=A0A917GZC7_9MICC|nr:hypothetical protein GCM10011374_27040 [Kocuria dechangensis]